MTNLLNWKVYIIIVLLFFSVAQTYRLYNVQKQYDETVMDNIKLNDAINSAQALYNKQSDLLRLKEQEVAARARQSQKHMDIIMNTNVPKECKKAIAWMASVGTRY